MVQNAYDISIDRKYGTRKAHLIRLIGAATLSVALIIGYFGIVTAYVCVFSSGKATEVGSTS